MVRKTSGIVEAPFLRREWVGISCLVSGVIVTCLNWARRHAFRSARYPEAALWRRERFKFSSQC